VTDSGQQSDANQKHHPPGLPCRLLAGTFLHDPGADSLDRRCRTSPRIKRRSPIFLELFRPLSQLGPHAASVLLISPPRTTLGPDTTVPTSIRNARAASSCDKPFLASKANGTIASLREEFAGRLPEIVF